MQATIAATTVADSIEIQGTPTHITIRVERASLQRDVLVLKEHGKPIATLTPIAREKVENNEYKNGAPERPAEATRFPEFEQEINSFEKMKPELLEKYPGQAVAVYQGKVVAVGKNKMDALHNAEKIMGAIPCYVEWVTPITPRQVSSPAVFIKR